MMANISYATPESRTLANYSHPNNVWIRVMKLNWKPNAKPELILSRIDASRQPNGETFSLSGWESAMQSPVLETMLKFPTEILREDWSRIVFQGLCRAKAPLDKDTFLAAAAAEARAHSARPIQEYVVLTALSISPSLIPRSVTWGNCLITSIKGNYPKKYRSRAERLNNSGEFKDDTPENYSRLAIRVKCKSPARAVSQALMQLNEVRAMLNIFANYSFEFIGGFMTPINKIRLGRVHTVHHPDGTLATETIWHESNFKPTKVYDGASSPSVYEMARRFLNRLKTIPYAADVKESLAQFVRGLDEQDANVAFLRLWSALERLVTSDQEALIRRCAFISSDREARVLTLKHLQKYRNDAVHEGVETDNAKREAYLLLEFYVEMLRFHLGNGFLFTSLAEANEFLDYPADVNILRRKKRLIERAIFYQSPPNE